MEEICINTRCFNLKYTVECGQCFRWEKVENYYVGVIFDRVLKVRQENEKIFIKSSKMENLEEIVKQYFDLDTNYFEIENKISCIDDNVKKAVKNSTGIHILNQDFFEMVLSYIISANNNIPRISKSINEISKRYGKEIIFENEKYYLFPTIDDLKDVNEEEFRNCGVGFRAKYLKNTIKYIKDNNINFDYMMSLDTTLAREILLKMQGVGPKVADCILLFSLKRKEVFPIDVWVERVMSKIYFEKLNGKVSKKDILNYSKNNFNIYSGIVQQHLFYNVRENMI